MSQTSMTSALFRTLLIRTRSIQACSFCGAISASPVLATSASHKNIGDSTTSESPVIKREITNNFTSYILRQTTRPDRSGAVSGNT